MTTFKHDDKCFNIDRISEVKRSRSQKNGKKILMEKLNIIYYIVPRKDGRKEIRRTR